MLDLQAGATVAYRPGPSGALVRSVLSQSVPSFHFRHVDGLLLGVPHAGGVYRFQAIDARDGRIRWELPAPNRLPAVTKAERAGEVLVALVVYGVDPYEPNELVAFDRVTGRIRWRRPQPPSTVHRLAGSKERLIVLRHDGELAALSAADGSVLWRDAEVLAPREDARDRVDIAVAGRHVLIAVSGRALRILDATTGKEHHRWATTDGLNAVAAADGMGYAIQRAGPTEQLSVVAIDLNCGTKTWQTQVPAVEFRGDGLLAVGANAVYGCGGWGRLFALDRTSGKPRWRYDLARCDPRFAPVVLPSVGGRPETLIAKPEGDDELLLFEPTEALEQPHAVTVQGQVRLEGLPPQGGFVITVGGERGATDRHGRYQITTQGRGRLWVYVARRPDVDGDYHCPVVNLRLEGRQRHIVNFRCTRHYEY